MSRTNPVSACAQGHEYTDENTYRQPNGERHCRECMRVATRAYQARIRRERRPASAPPEVESDPTPVFQTVVPYGPYPKLPRRIPSFRELTAPAMTAREKELIRRLI